MAKARSDGNYYVLILISGYFIAVIQFIQLPNQNGIVRGQKEGNRNHRMYRYTEKSAFLKYFFRTYSYPRNYLDPLNIISESLIFKKLGLNK